MLLKKNDNVEDEKVVFVYENIGIKDDRDSVTRQENLQKRKIRFEIRNGSLSFICSSRFIVYALNDGRSGIIKHNMSFHIFVSCIHACIMQDIE